MVILSIARWGSRCKEVKPGVPHSQRDTESSPKEPVPNPIDIPMWLLSSIFPTTAARVLGSKQTVKEGLFLHRGQQHWPWAALPISFNSGCHRLQRRTFGELLVILSIARTLQATAEPHGTVPATSGQVLSDPKQVSSLQERPRNMLGDRCLMGKCCTCLWRELSPVAMLCYVHRTRTKWGGAVWFSRKFC